MAHRGGAMGVGAQESVRPANDAEGAGGGEPRLFKSGAARTDARKRCEVETRPRPRTLLESPSMPIMPKAGSQQPTHYARHVTQALFGFC